MLRNSESETEILLGNKQLLGIFLVVAILLGVAFTGGYMVGRGSSGKKSVATATPVAGAESGDTGNGTGGETHSVEPQQPGSGAVARDESTGEAGQAAAREEPLGAPKHAKTQKSAVAEPPATPQAAGQFTPQGGQEFLQVAAVSHDEALAIADVLHKKGFRAHAVARPGNTKLYRVLIGPIRDAGDLSSTRDALRKTGFRDVIVQRY